MNGFCIALRRTVLLAAAAAFAVALTAAPASAATKVGIPLAEFSPTYAESGTTIVQRRVFDVDGATYNGFAVGGVLTSVSVRARLNAGVIDVSVLRKTADPTADTATFLSMATLNIAVPAESASEGAVTTVPTKIPVNAGDRFGVNSASSGVDYLGGFGGGDQDFCFYLEAPHVLGESNTYLSESCNNFVPLVEGNLEADRDGDGYGDDTQDFCPALATQQTACPACPLIAIVPPLPGCPGLPPANLAIKAVKSKAKVGSAATRSFTITNKGAGAATPVTLTLSSSQKVKKFTFIKGCKAAKGGKSCTIATLAPGASITVKVKVTPKASTSTRLTAKVTTRGETMLADNSATTSVKFKLTK